MHKQTHNSRFRAALIVTLASCLLFSSSAFAVRSSERVRRLGRSFAERHGFPLREIPVRLDNGQVVTRVFVPVTAGALPDFVQTFNKTNGSVITYAKNLYPRNYRDGHNKFVRLVTSPDLIFSSAYDFGAQRSDVIRGLGNAGTRGRYVVLALGQKKATHLERFVEERHRNKKYRNAHGQFRQERQLSESEAECVANCMWWFVHGETAPNENIGEAVGVRRSRAPENLTAKFVHKGNSRISVIGIPVRRLEHFEQLSDADLLGPAPLPETYQPARN